MKDIIAILIDITTDQASIGLSKNEAMIAMNYFSNQQSSMSEIHVFIEELLCKNNLTFRDLHFIAVSQGPGSYTGLRIAYSSVKGICFASSLPLIEVGTLQSWRSFFTYEKEALEIIPMMDARNNNVFTLDEDGKAIFVELNEKEKINQFLKWRDGFYIGSGAKVLKGYIGENRINDKQLFDVKCMLSMALDKYARHDFSDIAYCEPNYLKPAHITVSKKQLF